jgi:hypothetical protein
VLARDPRAKTTKRSFENEAALALNEIEFDWNYW